MKICETCQQPFGKRRNEAYWQYEQRRFCSKTCVRRVLKPDDQLAPSYRYRRTKISGRPIDTHRATMERQLGRRLERHEIVHHDNHIKLDNAPGNLVLTTPKAHSVHHNQKHPLTKPCVICGAIFTPHPTKRARAQTCGPECKRALLSKRHADYRASSGTAPSENCSDDHRPPGTRREVVG